ncbi:hypothetical protein ABFS83_10G126400 [Erythranthe nasuta]
MWKGAGADTINFFSLLTPNNGLFPPSDPPDCIFFFQQYKRGQMKFNNQKFVSKLTRVIFHLFFVLEVSVIFNSTTAPKVRIFQTFLFFPNFLCCSVGYLVCSN